jgi:hypothetical protein
MFGLLKSRTPGVELAALGRGGEALPMPEGIGDDSAA